MSDPLLPITEVRFVAAGPQERDRGLLGWVSCCLNGVLKLDGITVRRTVTGQLRLSFPERRDQAGGSHPYIRPLNDAARRAMEDAVFRALGLEGGVSP